MRGRLAPSRCFPNPPPHSSMCRGLVRGGAVVQEDAVGGIQLVLLATTVVTLVDLIGRLGHAHPANTLLTDVGSAKAAVDERALGVFGKNAGKRFLDGHPMAGHE